MDLKSFLRTVASFNLVYFPLLEGRPRCERRRRGSRGSCCLRVTGGGDKYLDLRGRAGALPSPNQILLLEKLIAT